MARFAASWQCRVPSPVRDYRARAKEILVMQGILAGAHVRPPLLPIGPEGRQALKRALEDAGQL